MILKLPYNNTLVYIFIFIFLLFSSHVIWSQKKDTLLLKNNDKIIGEIKQMDQGVVTVKTSYSDKDFKVKWRQVKQISTMQTFLVSLSNGKRFNSKVFTSEEDEAIVYDGNEIYSVQIKDIVFLKPLTSSFFSKMRFSTISIGYNFTKSNNLKQLTINSTIYYTAFKWMLTGKYNSVLSNQDDTEQTRRIDANINMTRFMKNDWFYAGAVGFLSNDEQKLKLRTTFSGGLGKYLIHTNLMTLATGGGLAYTKERYNDEFNTIKNSLEAYIGAGYKIFDYKDLSLNTLATFYPSLTEKDRYRLDFDFNIKYDLPMDFYIQFGVNYNYDSQPVEGASSVDYVYQTTFGWEFK